jgi:predicted ATPase/DNA-binding CsgD family transcriptional regulator
VRERRHTRIPLLPGPLVGREEELTFVRRLLLEEDARLVTLTGPPGVGKTSLALALAADLEDRFADGARFVDLSTTSDADLVTVAVADGLGAGGFGGPLERLVAYLANLQVLLVVDNFEHVLSAAPLIAELLRRCRELTILVTSRAPLRLRWEHEVPLEPLVLPDLADAVQLHVLRSTPAVHLFVERARAVNPAFTLTEANATAVAELCRRLDGLPLALELAAARARVMSPAAMLRQLAVIETDALPGAPTPGGSSHSSALRILAGGARDLPPRQRALHGAIDWSYALLDEAERRVFRHLGTFVGGCTIEAAEAVCGEGTGAEGPHTSGIDVFSSDTPGPSPLDLIGSLVEKSLLRLEDTESVQPRVRMLQTIQEYALEQLAASGEAASLELEHAAYYLSLAEQAAPELVGPHSTDWMDRLDRDRGNLRAAGRRAAARGDAETVLRLGAALWRFWWARSDAAEARERVEGILALAAVMPPSSARARALHGAGVLACELGEYPRARTLLGESLTIAREVDDRPIVVGVLDSLGWLAQQQGAYPEARAYLSESLDLAQRLGDRPATAGILTRLAYVVFADRDREGALALNDRSLEIARASGDRRIIGDVLFNLGVIAHVDRDLAKARDYYEQSRAMFQTVGHRPALAQTLHLMGHVAVLQGDIDTARGLFREALVTSRTAGNRRRLAFVLWAVGTLMVREGEHERAVRLDSAAHAAAGLMGAVIIRPVGDLYDSLLAPAHEALGSLGVVEARTAGRAMTLQDAVDEALTWLAADWGETAGPPPSTSEDSVATHLSHPPGMAETFSGDDRSPAPTQAPGLELLTPREREIAALIGQGLTSREIAEHLVIGKGTADAHADHIRTKLELRSRAEIAVWAARHGLLEAPRPD